MVLAQFGTISFPINPQEMSRTYLRPVAVKSILGSHQTLESKKKSLVGMSLSGILTGENAKSTMDSLETALEEAKTQLLVTPSFPGGEMALLRETEFKIEQIKFYERLIQFRLDFILTSAAAIPSWEVKVSNGATPPVFNAVEGLMEVTVNNPFGGTAASFEFIADNRDGQNNYPVFDYQRDVKIELGYWVDSLYTYRNRRIWGLIDTLDYNITKATGSTIRVGGRNYFARMLEGYHVDRTYVDMYPNDIVLDLLTGTGIGTDMLGSPDWSLWPTGEPWFTYQVAYNSPRLEVLQKVSDLYRMQFYLDDGESFAGWPQLVWRPQRRISMLTENGLAGHNYVIVDIPEQFQVGETVTITDASLSIFMTHVQSISGNTIYLTDNLNHLYAVNQGAVIYSGTWTTELDVIRKNWGEDIMKVDVRLTGIPIRTRVFVQGEGYYCLADASSPYLDPSGTGNAGYNLAAVAKYGTRLTIIEDASIRSQPVADVVAERELVVNEMPELEIRVLIPGDNSIRPGMLFAFQDNGITGVSGCYRINEINEKLSTDGYTMELVLRRVVQTAPIQLLSDVIKSQAKYVSGALALYDTRIMYPKAGIIP